MITPQQLYNLNFYQSQSFFGSYQGMHYRISKAEEAQAAGEDPPADAAIAAHTVFRVAVWPGPYNFASTPPERIEFFTYPFEAKSLLAICDFLNRKWEAEYGPKQT